MQNVSLESSQRTNFRLLRTREPGIFISNGVQSKRLGATARKSFLKIKGQPWGLHHLKLYRVRHDPKHVYLAVCFMEAYDQESGE